jgi:tryptophan synthase alpha chain
LSQHCCDTMRHYVTWECDMHPTRADCGDCIVEYWPDQDRYGILIHDGGTSMVAIAFCPWCGAALPDADKASGQRMINWSDADDEDDDLPHDPERLEKAFAAARDQGRAALVTFITAGDGDTDAVLDALVAGGADVIELGVPFTDPMADGPTIQAANLRSLGKGTRVVDVLRFASDFRRRHPGVPLVLMGYANTLAEVSFASKAAKAGVDGAIIVDVPPEEADSVEQYGQWGLHLIRLATPTTDAARLPAVVKGASGFLYYVSVAGITGLQQAAQASIEDAVARIKAATDLPVAVGFGVRTPEQAAAIGRIADGVVVGSALVELVGRHGNDAPEHVRAYTASLRAAIDAAGKEVA